MKRKFVIDRSKWVCGWKDLDSRQLKSTDSRSKYGRGKAKLLNKEGFQCCLGQISSQCGIEDDVLLDVPMPEGDEFNNVSFLFDLLEEENQIDIYNTLEECAAHLNDSGMTVDKIEQELTKLFAKQDIELEFVGEIVEEE